MGYGKGCDICQHDSGKLGLSSALNLARQGFEQCVTNVTPFLGMEGNAVGI